MSRSLQRMFSAARRRRQAQAGHHGPPPFAKLAAQCKQALDSAVENIIASRGAAGQLVLRSASDAAQRLGVALAGHRALLLASMSNSALEQAAFLPSKSRAAKQGPVLSASSTEPLQQQDDGNEEEDQRILISEVEILGVDGELKELAKKAMTIKPNFAYFKGEVGEDMQRIFDSGFFHNVEGRAEDTRDGIKLTVEVAANPTLRSISIVGANQLPQSVVQAAFRNMYGRPLNYNHLSAAVSKLTKWYEDNGVLGQVTDIYTTSGDAVEVRVAEAVVSRINLRYLDKKSGEARDEGKTKPEVILRNLTTKPGQVYNLHQAKRDVESVYGLGIFEDVSIRPMSASGSTIEDPHVDLELEVKEKKARGLSAGGGVSQSGASEGMMPGFVGRLAFSDRNLFGKGQKVVAELNVNQTGHPQADMSFRVAHTDPWVRGDPHHTSRTISADFNKSATSVIHGRAPDDQEGALGFGAAGGAAGEDGVYVQRMVGKVEWGRPLGTGWHGNLGVTWQQAKCLDEVGDVMTQDHYGSQVAFSESGTDTLALGLLRVAYDSESRDSSAVVSMEQAVPLQQDWLNFNRLTVRAEKAVALGPASIWVCGKGGMIIGDLPPYEAFPIGGTNSVRGYAEGAVGTGRKHVTGTAELRIPLVKAIAGTLFVDGGTDLDSGATVPGDPAGRRQKPGHGYGVGAGIRIDTPLGPLRLEYAWNDRRQRRFHLGVGHG